MIDQCLRIWRSGLTMFWNPRTLILYMWMEIPVALRAFE